MYIKGTQNKVTVGNSITKEVNDRRGGQGGVYNRFCT